MNGFNETPTPADLDADIVKALERFQSALARRPDWIEVKLAMLGCWGNRIFLAGQDSEKRRKLLEEASGPTTSGSCSTRATTRVCSGSKAASRWSFLRPAAATGRKRPRRSAQGVAGAWREAGATPPAPPWAPTWGGPENLMNLAYLYSRDKTPDRSTALAYAEGALTAVPEWHYVKDVLLPQIEAMPLPAAVAAAAP